MIRRVLVPILGVIFLLALHFTLTNQNVLLGRNLIVYDPTMLYVMYISIFTALLLGVSSKTSSMSLIPLSIAAFSLIDIVFLNLSLHGLGYLYLIYSTVRTPLIVFLVSFSASFVKIQKTRYQIVLTSSSIFVAGISAYLLISAFNFPESEGLAIAIFAIFAILFATVLANISENEMLVWLRGKRAFLISVILILTIYLIFLKPYIGSRTGIANFIEWIIVGMAFFKLSRDFKRSVVVEESKISGHAQRIDFRKDELYDAIERAERAFIENGVKIPVVVLLSRVLGESASIDKTIHILSDLVNYEPEKIPFLSFPWEKEMIKRRDRKRREKIISEIKKKIKEEGVKFGYQYGRL
jgi:hypothetical protein